MILITGGAGFIGSNLVSALEARGVGPLFVCDRLRSKGKWQNICRRNLQDIVHPDHLFSFLEKNEKKLDLIFHLGAVSTTTETDADLILQSNFKLSRDLFTWCSQKHKRFIYASSAATYGDGTHGFEDLYTPGHLALFRPLNAYAWSKHWFDRRIVEDLAQGGNRPSQWVGLKFFNVYGPNEYHKGAQQSVVSHVFRTIYHEKKPARLFKSYHPSFPDGGQLRDFIWVQDCVDFMIWLMENPTVNGIFNLGTGEARSFLDLALGVYKALNLSPDIQFIDMPEGLADAYQYFTKASIDSRHRVGYQKPPTSLEEGIRLYVQEYLTRKDPYV